MGIGRHFGLSSDKANNPGKERDFKEISWRQCQCSSSSQIPSQNDLNNYHQFLELYKISWKDNKTELTIYNTENKKEEVKMLEPPIILNESASITQLPNGELFCNCSFLMNIILDRNYRAKKVPNKAYCPWSSALYYRNNIYCFGGYTLTVAQNLSSRFDLEKRLWFQLAKLPEADHRCHSVIFNGNILISGICSKNLWLYSIEIDSFSTIPHDFSENRRKVLINIEKLYLIEWDENGLIYESEDEYHWKKIAKSNVSFDMHTQIYCLYTEEKIYFAASDKYYQFDLKKKKLFEFKV